MTNLHSSCLARSGRRNLPPQSGRALAVADNCRTTANHRKRAILASAPVWHRARPKLARGLDHAHTWPCGAAACWRKRRRHRAIRCSRVQIQQTGGRERRTRAAGAQGCLPLGRFHGCRASAHRQRHSRRRSGHIVEGGRRDRCASLMLGSNLLHKHLLRLHLHAALQITDRRVLTLHGLLGSFKSGHEVFLLSVPICQRCVQGGRRASRWPTALLIRRAGSHGRRTVVSSKLGLAKLSCTFLRHAWIPDRGGWRARTDNRGWDVYVRLPVACAATGFWAIVAWPSHPRAVDKR